MARNDFRLHRQGTPPDWGPMADGATFNEGEPLIVNTAGYVVIPAASDPSDVVGIASTRSRDVNGNVHTVGEPITYHRQSSENEFITANFATAGAGAAVVPTITRIGEQAGFSLNIAGTNWFVDVGCANQLVEITDVLDGNQRSLTDTHNGYVPGAGAQVVFRFLSVLLALFFMASTAVAEPSYNRTPNCTVANLATCAGTQDGRTAYVIDALHSSDCTVGGGSDEVLCVMDSTDWKPAAMGGVSEDFYIQDASVLLGMRDSDMTFDPNEPYNSAFYQSCALRDANDADTEDCDLNIAQETNGTLQIPLTVTAGANPYDPNGNEGGTSSAVWLWLPYGDDPPATCTPGQIFIDINEADDDNCTTTADNSICVCVAANTWASTE